MGWDFMAHFFVGGKKVKVTNGHKEVIFCPFHGVLFDNIMSYLSFPKTIFRYLRCSRQKSYHREESSLVKSS